MQQQQQCHKLAKTVLVCSDSSILSVLLSFPILTFSCRYLRSEEADRGAFGPHGAEPLGGDPQGGLQACP